MDLAAVVLAAGLGTRLRPLTDLRPKSLCPVNNVPLVDWNIERVSRHASAVAVNVHHHRAQLEAHLEGRAHLSAELQEPLGTAGAIGNLKAWIADRPALVVNADSWHQDSLDELIGHWDGERPRLLVVADEERPDFDGRWRYASACLIPARIVNRLPAAPAGLFHEVFSREPLDLCRSSTAFYDCGTPAEYHAANIAASGGLNVIGEGARVEGDIERCVLWPNTVVEPGEKLRNAIRASREITLFV